MADFDAILRKALASRPGAPGEDRRKIYERARQALIRQLTSFEPPLPPEDISRQRLALESAIRKVEADVAANGGVLPAAPPPVLPPESVLMPSAPTGGDAQRTSANEPRFDPAPAEAPATIIAASSMADKALGGVARSPERFGERGADRLPPRASEMVGDPSSADLPDFEPERSQPVRPAKRKGASSGIVVAVIALVLAGGGAVLAWQGGYLDAFLPGNESAGEQAATSETLPIAPQVRTVGGSDPTQSSERLLPDNQGTVEAPVELAPEAATEPAPVAEAEQPPSEPAATEVASAEPSNLPVAQSAILYEEGASPDAAGFTAPGRAIWRLDESGADPVISGTIEVPARGIAVEMRISRNRDEGLPATHLIEFAFNLSEAFPAEGVADLVGVVVKPEEQSGGDPLIGAIVDLGDGLFWQALSANEADRSINAPLLREGEWFDLPILYADNRRAIISFEKGSNGDDVFAAALSAWAN